MNDNDREPKIHPTAHVDDTVELGDWSVVHARTQINGDVKIGRAAWISEDVIIGGGQSELGSLRAGDFLHMGIRSFVNIADVVTIGREVGLGVDTKIFTHGGYLSELDGFPFTRGPVRIGNHVWLPNAIVLPNVSIGSSTVVSAMSLVNKDMPCCSLVGGIPAKVLNHDIYLHPMIDVTSFFESIKVDASRYGIDVEIHELVLCVGMTKFEPACKEIDGPVTRDTERVKDLFRRRGVRFEYYDNGGSYQQWD